MTTLTKNTQQSCNARKDSANTRLHQDLEKLIRESGVSPIESMDQLYAKSFVGDESEDETRADVDEFLALLEQVRKQ